MGVSKLAEELAPGNPMGSLGLRTLLALGLHRVVVVVHPTDPLHWIPAEYRAAAQKGSGRAFTLAVCSDAGEGMSRSLQCGLRAAFTDQTDAALVMLADQPFITLPWLQELIDDWNSCCSLDYMLSGEGEASGPPALLARTMLTPAMSLEGDQGAKRLTRLSRWHGRSKAPKVPELLMDIDTPDELQAARALWHARLHDGGS